MDNKKLVNDVHEQLRKVKEFFRVDPEDLEANRMREERIRKLEAEGDGENMGINSSSAEDAPPISTRALVSDADLAVRALGLSHKFAQIEGYEVDSNFRFDTSDNPMAQKIWNLVKTAFETISETPIDDDVMQAIPNIHMVIELELLMSREEHQDLCDFLRESRVASMQLVSTIGTKMEFERPPLAILIRQK